MNFTQWPPTPAESAGYHFSAKAHDLERGRVFQFLNFSVLIFRKQC